MARSRSTFSDIRVSPRNQRLLKWLRRKPTPSVVVGETEEGEERRAVVSLTGPTIWSDVLSVVRPCVHLDALDKEGQTLRSLDLDPDDPELRAESEIEAATAIARSAPGSVPIISVDIPRLVDNLARNMREVASESARQQSSAFRDGFAAMTNVVNLCLNLLQRVDERLAEQEAQADARGAPPEEPQLGQREQLVAMALQKAMGNGIPAGGLQGLNLQQVLQMVQSLQQQPPEGES
jgi:hypothetical protein